MSRGADLDRRPCLRCALPRTAHPKGCPVPTSVLRALATLRDEGGPKWRSNLKRAWARGECKVGPLGEAFSLIGPDRLKRIVLPE